ncbi:aromatic-ring-hydroxylating dioxygenase subunit beta [Peribacillus saganii]|uniref:Aromatic-ring-hydroxylating dioxygenase subunit beta n=1 Tax=Peribacillus saganii TaxID=2303992 RepID=A0A372LRF4_9BACI|nr:aromatic-ring-hydroxylating dioxygenase subunit beta [Peribacillus saganii]RFU70497.1 aromatic-ring-hydroxylating dioxygenase subunit beta [Peribacillus saganii]
MNTVMVERKEIEDFLIHEAFLINEEKFSEWLDLFTEDGIYWIPSNKDHIDPNTHVSIIYDDRERLEERVWRLESGLAYGQEPKSRTRHLITNVKILESDDQKVVVSSNFILVELRRSIQTIWSGRFEHQLRSQGGTWKIASKKVELINNNEFIGNLSFIV